MSTDAANSRIVSGTTGYVMRELEHAHTRRVELVERQPEIGERLHDVEVRLARAHDAERARPGPAPTTRSSPLWRA